MKLFFYSFSLFTLKSAKLSLELLPKNKAKKIKSNREKCNFEEINDFRILGACTIIIFADCTLNQVLKARIEYYPRTYILDNVDFIR